MLTTVVVHEQLLIENILLDKLSEKKDQLISFWKKKADNVFDRMKLIEKKLEDAGINVDKVIRDAKLAAGKSKIKNGKVENLKSTVNEFYNSFRNKKYFNNNNNEEDPSIITQTIVSVSLLAVVVFLNVYFLKLFTVLLGPTIGPQVSKIIITPFIEETSKMISVRQKSTGIYFILFNLFEFYNYILSPLKIGESIISKIISTGIPPVLMHTLTTLIHVDANKSNDSISGLKLSFIIHAIWNALSVFK